MGADNNSKNGGINFSLDEDDFDKMSDSQFKKFKKQLTIVFKKFVPNFTGSVELHLVNGEPKVFKKTKTLKRPTRSSEDTLSSVATTSDGAKPSDDKI